MTQLIGYAAIAFLTLVIYGAMCTVLPWAADVPCRVTHWYLRRWGSGLQCPICNEDMHLANSQRPIQFSMNERN